MLYSQNHRGIIEPVFNRARNLDFAIAVIHLHEGLNRVTRVAGFGAWVGLSQGCGGTCGSNDAGAAEFEKISSGNCVFHESLISGLVLRLINVPQVFL